MWIIPGAIALVVYLVTGPFVERRDRRVLLAMAAAVVGFIALVVWWGGPSR